MLLSWALSFLFLSLPAWGAWIEILSDGILSVIFSSLPAWGAWIEIIMLKANIALLMVAPRMGSVD